MCVQYLKIIVLDARGTAAGRTVMDTSGGGVGLLSSPAVADLFSRAGRGQESTAASSGPAPGQRQQSPWPTALGPPPRTTSDPPAASDTPGPHTSAAVSAGGGGGGGGVPLTAAVFPSRVGGGDGLQFNLASRASAASFYGAVDGEASPPRQSTNDYRPTSGKHAANLVLKIHQNTTNYDNLYSPA